MITLLSAPARMFRRFVSSRPADRTYRPLAIPTRRVSRVISHTRALSALISVDVALGAIRLP